jgi:hypothetical protein
VGLEKETHERPNVYGDPAYERVAGMLKSELRRLQQQYKDT